jgi:hypothetical protein
VAPLAGAGNGMELGLGASAMVETGAMFRRPERVG